MPANRWEGGGRVSGLPESCAGVLSGQDGADDSGAIQHQDVSHARQVGSVKHATHLFLLSATDRVCWLAGLEGGRPPGPAPMCRYQPLCCPSAVSTLKRAVSTLRGKSAA